MSCFSKVNFTVDLVAFEAFVFQDFEGIKNHIAVSAEVKMRFRRKSASFQITGQSPVVSSFLIAA
jgi:hypothetical protein